MMRKLALSVALVLTAVLASPSVSHAGKRLNGVELNGKRLNGKRLNGKRLNGKRLNGKRLNGKRLNGKRLNQRLRVDVSKPQLSGLSMAAPGVSLNGVVVAL